MIDYIDTRKKNTIFFHVRCYGFSQGRKSLSNTAVYVILCCCLIVENGEAIYKVFHYI